MKEYGIDYTVLLGGTQDERDAKLTQPVNLNSWPTTFFLGRDGRVRFVHAGFPGPASGDLYHQAVKSFTRRWIACWRKSRRPQRPAFVRTARATAVPRIVRNRDRW
jgi:hypothetical protein